MKSIDRLSRETSAMIRALSIAGRNASTGGELALASGQVIATRVALGMAGITDPVNADHRELARILPEKAKAVSAAGAVLLQRSGQIGQQATTFAVNELMATARATMAMAACRSPAALATSQSNFALGWWGRVMSQSIALSAMAVRSQREAMAPFHQAATANARRLGR